MISPLAQLIAQLRDGTIVKGRHLKAALKAIARMAPLQGANIALREYPDGTVISTATAEAEPCPLTGVASGNRFELTSAGLIGGLIPVNLFDGSGDLYFYEPISTGGPQFAWLVANCTSSNGRLTDVELDFIFTAPPVITPTEGAPPTAFTVPLYAIYVTAEGVPTAYRLWGCGNLNLRPRRIYFRVDATAGCAYPLIHTWTWEVTG
jgi:hypothetical protein